MKIIIVSQYFFPEEFLVNDFAWGLERRGHDVIVFTGLPNYPSGKFFKGYSIFSGPYKEVINGITIHRVPILPRGNSCGWRLALNYISFVLSGILGGLIFGGQRFDCILVYQMSPVTMGIPARFIKWFTKSQLVFWIHDLWPESLTAGGELTNRFVLYIMELITRWIYKGCDEVLIQSEAFRASVSGKGINQSRIHLYQNWANNFNLLKPNKDWAERKLIPNGFCLMFAGNIGDAQDFKTIVTAAKITMQKAPDIKWIILGDGRARAWVEQEITKKKINNIYLLGRFPREKMQIFFSFADVMLVSLKRNPIFAMTIPSKIQAYFASAKPVIASLDGEGARIISNAKAGICVPSETPEMLANAAITMSKMSKKELVNMGNNGLRYGLENFSLLRNLENFELLVKQHQRDVNNFE